MTSTGIKKKWAQVAVQELEAFTAADFDGVDPKQYHDALVDQYYEQYRATTLSEAKIARIRSVLSCPLTPRKTHHASDSDGLHILAATIRMKRSTSPLPSNSQQGRKFGRSTSILGVCCL